MKFILDAHLDLAMNALEWNRDLTKSISSINHLEKNLKDKPDRGNATVSLEELRKGNIGFCVSTLIARFVKPSNKLPGWNSPEQAWAQIQGQLAWYNVMEKSGEMIQIINSKELKNHLKLWENKNDNKKKPIGYLLSLEGADSIIKIEYLEKLYNQGLRAIGPAHYGPGTYAHGTNSKGGIGIKGRELLNKIDELNLILDVTHLCDLSFWETINFYKGKLWASHSNCRSIVPNERQFTDEQINEIISRGGIIGMALDAWMMIPNWKKGISSPKKSGLILDKIIDHIDHICQLTGNSNHVGIGSDLDGGFGKEQCPSDLNSIADLQKIDKLLTNRGYKKLDIEKILSKNFINFISSVLN
ncbi:MAG: membrane dipeptidase [Flavobacteriaceae bacterium]|nr:membrane dipeptidase [Flavobacteriaceae bacterium]